MISEGISGNEIDKTKFNKVLFEYYLIKLRLYFVLKHNKI